MFSGVRLPCIASADQPAPGVLHWVEPFEFEGPVPGPQRIGGGYFGHGVLIPKVICVSAVGRQTTFF